MNIIFNTMKILIIGGTSGIGLSIAEKLTNHEIIIVGRRKMNLQNSIQADINTENGRKHIIESLKEPIDVLINNAGITDDQMLIRMKDENIDHLFNTNLISIIKILLGSLSIGITLDGPEVD